MVIIDSESFWSRQKSSCTAKDNKQLSMVIGDAVRGRENYI